MTGHLTLGELTVGELRQLVADGTIDTVAVAFTDMQGRLQGKRVNAQFFLDTVADHGTEGCNYLLAVDVEMNTVAGYAMSSWETGYGDMVFKPDLATLHRISWHSGTVGVLCDLTWEDGQPVVASPRQILRKQLDRLAQFGLNAFVGTELEFIVFLDTYEEAWRREYHKLTPANHYNVDYSMLGTGRIEPLLSAIRRAMANAGMVVESVKGECNPGQHEIAFLYRDALGTCDNHSIYKSASKEIAAQHNMSLTFMSKFNQREGSSCHIHMSVRNDDGRAVMADDSDPHGLSSLGRSFIAGQLAHAHELTLLFAPTINAYKRYVAGSFAPTALQWGRDNRTCAFRLVGHDSSLRIENRLPGGDVNPYLAVAGMVAAGIDGIERSLSLDEPCLGNAYGSTGEHVPRTMSDALSIWLNSPWIHDAFGSEVQDHYANMAAVEIDAFNTAVTDWERIRSFERF